MYIVYIYIYHICISYMYIIYVYHICISYIYIYIYHICISYMYIIYIYISYIYIYIRILYIYRDIDIVCIVIISIFTSVAEIRRARQPGAVPFPGQKLRGGIWRVGRCVGEVMQWSHEQNTLVTRPGKHTKSELENGHWNSEFTH